MGPDDTRRAAMADALSACAVSSIREVRYYPSDLEGLPRTLDDCDVVIIDLDANPEYALEIVECIQAGGLATPMVCSAHANLDLAVRCMRAGAREFITLPINTAVLADALARIATRGSTPTPTRRSARKLFAFLGAKGGCGVTTVAANFAISLAQESRQKTLLIDLGTPLGDAALNLGILTEYSTVNAVENSARLDGSFLATLLARHSSGLSVLAAPSEFSSLQPSIEALDKLLTVARTSFDYVVIDAGSRIELKDSKFMDDSAVIYHVTQVGVTELRNSNRMITQFFSGRGSKLQVVVNRYTPQALLFDDRQIEKALTKSIDWKIPDDYASARRTQLAATPLAMEDSPISRAIRRMARKACGLPEEETKSGRLGLLSWMRNGLSSNRSVQEPDETSPFAAQALDPHHAES
jgi:pilus assembly protein CpaE